MQAIGRSALFVVLFAAALYLFMLTREFDFPRVAGRLGPDVWPRTILFLLMIACIIGIGREALGRRGPEADRGHADTRTDLPGGAALPEAPATAFGYALVGTGFLLFLAYPVVLEYLGFPLATALFMVLFMLVGQWRNWLGIAAVSAAGAVGLFYAFRGLVYVSLPLGWGPFHEATLWVARLLGMR
jgi:putative tricarboxylic transport membrane protein